MIPKKEDTKMIKQGAPYMYRDDSYKIWIKKWQNDVLPICIGMILKSQQFQRMNGGAPYMYRDDSHAFTQMVKPSKCSLYV